MIRNPNLTDVIWVDPGHVHGFAHFSIKEYRMLEMMEMNTYYLCQQIRPMLWDPTTWVVGCEKFILNTNTIKKKNAAYEAIEGMGLVRFLATIERRAAIFNDIQTSSVVKAFCPDSVLKRCGWYKSSKDGHMNDAARHIYYWLGQNGLLGPPLTDALLEFPEVGTA